MFKWDSNEVKLIMNFLEKRMDFFLMQLKLFFQPLQFFNIWLNLCIWSVHNKCISRSNLREKIESALIELREIILKIDFKRSFKCAANKKWLIERQTPFIINNWCPNPATFLFNRRRKWKVFKLRFELL